MANTEKYEGKTLLYDPLFETPPDTVIRDTPGKGFFGKAVVKKTLFIVVLALFVGVSVWMSFHSLQKDKYDFDETEGGWQLSEFIADKYDKTLEIRCVITPEGEKQPDKTVTSVREYALCCNETTEYIFIGKDVKEIANTSFFSCTALRAVIVEEDNPFFAASEGVLYRCENGTPVEVLLYPQKNYLYRAALALGATTPASPEDADELDEWLDLLERKREGEYSSSEMTLTDEEAAALEAALHYEILPGVTKIGELAFAQCDDLLSASLPDSVKEIGSMAFFKCYHLEAIDLPDGVTTIGSDGFSYCEEVEDIFIPASVTSIGHHAFFGCDSAEAVRMACDEDHKPETGENWLPQYRKGVLRNRPVLYNEKRTGA